MPLRKQPTITLDAFARGRVDELLARLQGQLVNVVSAADPDAIHDLRVSIRRLTQALRALRGVFAKKSVRPVRRDLKDMMDLAAEIRNRDIALQLMSDAGIAPDSPLAKSFAIQRSANQRRLVNLARRWHRKKLIDDWKALLAGEAAA